MTQKRGVIWWKAGGITIYNCLNSDWKSPMFNPKVFVFWAGENKHQLGTVVQKKTSMHHIIFQVEFEGMWKLVDSVHSVLRGMHVSFRQKNPMSKMWLWGKETLALKASQWNQQKKKTKQMEIYWRDTVIPSLPFPLEVFGPKKHVVCLVFWLIKTLVSLQSSIFSPCNLIFFARKSDSSTGSQSSW